LIQSDIQVLGMLGLIELPDGIDKLEGTTGILGFRTLTKKATWESGLFDGQTWMS
jgi:phage tail tube protein FII